MAEGFRIRFVDLNGRPLDDLVSDQQFYIELYVRKAMGDPGNAVEVEFVTSEGTADVEITWTDTVDDEWKFTSTPLTVSGGGEGAGEVSIAGFSWSTGNLDRGEIEFEDGAPLTIQFKHPDGSEASGSVILFDTPLTMGLAQTAQYIAEADRVFRETLINIAAVREELTQYPDGDEKAAIEAGLDALEVDTQQRMKLVVAASGSIYRDDWVAHSRLAVALGYLDYLQLPPELLGNVRWTDALERERANKELADDEVRGIVMRGIGEATIGAYRLFANATLVAQTRTLLFGVNEMGQTATAGDRVVALLDLITEAALMGAGMKFQLNHLVAPTRPRTRIGLSRGVDAPRFEGARLSGADTGDIVSAEQVGMMRQATVEAQRVARRPRDGAPDGTLIWTRPSNIDGLAWRQQGHPPKGMEIKSKTINDVDVILGAEPGTQGLVGFFEPVLPSRAGFDPPFFARIEERFEHRMDEFNGTIGQHMRDLESSGQVRFDDGVVVDTGLYGNTGRGITGDYDLFEITDLDGNRVSTAVYDEIVGELMNAPSFQALHGAHMRWRDMPAFHKPAKLEENTRIFDNVVKKHRRGGEEPLVVFGGERPAFAIWSGEVPTHHLSDLQATLAATFSRNVSPDGIVIAGLSPLFATAEGQDDPAGSPDPLISLAQAVLGRTSLRDDENESQLLDPELDEAWTEFIRQAEGAARNPGVLDYLDESPFGPPSAGGVLALPDGLVTGDRVEEPAETDPAWDAEVARANARLAGPSNLDHETGLDDYGDPAAETDLEEHQDDADPEWDAVLAQAEARSQGSNLDHETGLDDYGDPAAETDLEEHQDDADPEWDAVVAQAEARSQDSVLDHETGIDEESGIDPGDPPPVAATESVLNYLGGETDLGATPVPPDESVLDYIDPEPERPPSSPFEAIDRELEAERRAEEQAPPRRRISIWLWSAAAVAILAIGGFFAFAGGGDDEPAENVSGGSGGNAPIATSTVAAPAAATALSTVPPTAPPAGATMAPVRIPTLRICPDGSSFSGLEQPDGSFLDAETGEVRVCPPPPS